MAVSIMRLISMKLGRCAKCMRLSLSLTVLAWFTVLAARLLWPTDGVWRLALVPTTGLTTLWFLHVGTFAARRVGTKPQGLAARPQMSGDKSLQVDLPSATHGDLGRRSVLRLLFKGAAVAVLASLPFPRASWAQCNTCAPGGINCQSSVNSCTNCCCPDGYPYLSYCDCTCYQSSPDCNNYNGSCR